MKKLLEILRLYRECQLSQRQISKATNVARSTVGNYITLFDDSGLSWPLLEEYQNEDKLSQRLDPNYKPLAVENPVLSFVEINKELHKHKHLTLQLLWKEYTDSNRIDCCYSNFTKMYRKWLGKQPTYMR